MVTILPSKEHFRFPFLKFSISFLPYSKWLVMRMCPGIFDLSFFSDRTHLGPFETRLHFLGQFCWGIRQTSQCSGPWSWSCCSVIQVLKLEKFASKDIYWTVPLRMTRGLQGGLIDYTRSLYERSLVRSLYSQFPLSLTLYVALLNFGFWLRVVLPSA